MLINQYHYSTYIASIAKHSVRTTIVSQWL